MNACECGFSSEKPSDAQLVTGEIASVGGWEFDLNTMEGRWTEEVARIHRSRSRPEAGRGVGTKFFNDRRRG